MAYKRILLKLSGEALMGDDSYGINHAVMEHVVSEIFEVVASCSIFEEEFLFSM